MCTEKHGPGSGQERVPEWMKKHICTSRSASDAHLLTDSSFVTPECASQVDQGGGTQGKTEHRPLVLFFIGEAWKETPSCFKARGLNSIESLWTPAWCTTSLHVSLEGHKGGQVWQQTTGSTGGRHGESPESGKCVYTSGPGMQEPFSSPYNWDHFSHWTRKPVRCRIWFSVWLLVFTQVSTWCKYRLSFKHCSALSALYPLFS